MPNTLVILKDSILIKDLPDGRPRLNIPFCELSMEISKNGSQLIIHYEDDVFSFDSSALGATPASFMDDFETAQAAGAIPHAEPNVVTINKVVAGGSYNVNEATAKIVEFIPDTAGTLYSIDGNPFSDRAGVITLNVPNTLATRLTVACSAGSVTVIEII